MLAMQSDIDYDFVSIANRHNLHSEFLVKCIKINTSFFRKTSWNKMEDYKIENIYPNQMKFLCTC